MKKTRCPLSCILYFLFAVHYLLFAAPATAQEEARLYVEPAQIAAKTEEIFVAKIRLAPGGECVNAAEIILSFDQKSLEIVDFSRGESIISLWTDSPSREKIALANES
ncbi:MAG TPA: hypothetical protein PKK37_05320, partial [Candidatus Pacearchaeota archaeon]|nr:hypothetical protein [Candidatus Pacearchaeota archaeon]